MDLKNDDLRETHDTANAAQSDEDRADLEYFGSINPADIGDWDTSSDNPLNSGNPKTATSAFEQAEIERRAALDFEQEQEHLGQDADKQE